MCGIAGMVCLDDGAADEERVAAMCERLAHRGPDDQGVWVEGPVGLGNRRLAVIDPSYAGHQPMANEDGTVSVAFNGEIYNFPELREQLQRAGHRFRSHTDTETIVHGYEEHGLDILARLNGMFAIAIWDARRNRLVLARDRAGKKPLAWYVDDRRLVFASELRALVAGVPDLDLTVDRSALGQYLVFGDYPAPLTPYARIRKVEPGQYLVLDGGRVTTGRFWEPVPGRPVEISEEDAVAEFGRLLTRAVRRRLISDVPLGAFLSGGIDSTSVVGVAAELATGPLKTFSIGYEDERYDEAAYARQVADHFGTDHTEMTLGPGDVSADDITRIMGSFDEPFYDSSAIPTWYVSQLARRDVTVVLSGDAGDELFIGYDHLREQAAEYKRRAKLGNRLLRRLVGRGDGDWAYAYVASWPRIPVETRRALLGDAGAPDGAAQLVRALDGWDGERDPIEALAGLDFRNYLPNDILVKVDRMTMQHSLEARVPLLDPEIIDFASRLPLHHKIRGAEGKVLMRRFLHRLLQDDSLYAAVTRRKHGFRFPLGRYVDGPLRPAIEEGLRDAAFQDELGLAPEGVEAVLADHYERGGPGKPLWLLFCLHLWWARTQAARLASLR